MESTFIEIFNPRKSNIIVRVIYRHPSMDLADFNCNYLNELLENTSKEQKSIFLLGDFNAITSLIIMSIMRLMNY